MSRQATQGINAPLGGFMEAAHIYDQSVILLDESIETAMALIDQNPDHIQHHVMLQQLTEHRETMRDSRDHCFARAMSQNETHAAPSGITGRGLTC